MTLDDALRIDDVSGTDVDGVVLTDIAVLERVRANGSLTLIRGPAERLRRSGWLDDVVDLADMRGMRLSIRDSGHLVLVLDTLWAGWSPVDNFTDKPASRAAHPSHGRGPRLARDSD